MLLRRAKPRNLLSSQHPRRLAVAFYVRNVPLLTLADFDAGTADGTANLERLRTATRRILAPQPQGVLRDAYINSLRADHKLNVPNEQAVYTSLVDLIRETHGEFAIGGVHPGPPGGRG